jgi:hypothetical protein
MSTEQPTLTDFEQTDQNDQTTTPEDALAPDQRSTVDWSVSVTNQCLNCESSIDAEVGRVVGDADGNVPCCKHCATDRHGRGTFVSTTSAVRTHRIEEGARR